MIEPLTREEERLARKDSFNYPDAAERLFATLDECRRNHGKHQEALCVVHAGGRVELYAHNRKVKLVAVPWVWESNEELAGDVMIKGLPEAYRDIYMPGYIKDTVQAGVTTVASQVEASQVKHMLNALKDLQ
jgi:hypothetical protein